MPFTFAKVAGATTRACDFSEHQFCVFCDGVVLHSLAKRSESDFDIALTPSEKILLSRQQPHPRGDDRERITRARQAAEALFTAKLPVSRPSVSDTPPADQSARKPRVLRITSPLPARHDEPQSPAAPAPLVREIPRSQFARIRALAKYGMTVAQLAQLYRVAVGEIKRILRRA